MTHVLISRASTFNKWLPGILGLCFLHLGQAAQAGPHLNVGPPQGFSYEALVDRAAAMAKGTYEAPPRPMPSVVEKIDYETWGNIRYRPESALFANGPGIFPATFFHVGQFFQKSVKMHVVENGQAREILYSSDYFSMPKNSIARKLSESFHPTFGNTDAECVTP